jgi:hypothetical protein
LGSFVSEDRCPSQVKVRAPNRRSYPVGVESSHRQGTSHVGDPRRKAKCQSVKRDWGGHDCRRIIPLTGWATVGTLLCVILALAQVGAAQEAGPLRLTPEEEHDSYAIYSMLLKQIAPRAVHRPLGISQETVKPGSGGEPHPLWPDCTETQRGIYGALIEDFKQRNAQPLLLQRKFDIRQYRLLTPGELKEIAARNPVVPPPPGTSPPAWRDATLEAVDGVYFLSAVGFSPDHQRAVVYVGTWNGGRCYFLVKKDGKWATDKDYRGTVCSWAS